MFGHATGQPEIKRSPSGGLSASARARSIEGRSNATSPITSVKLPSSTSINLLAESSSDDDEAEGEEEEEIGPMSSSSLQPPSGLSKSQIRRISRVLDEMELEFSANYTSLLPHRSSEHNVEHTFTNDTLYESPSVGPTPTKGSSRSRSTDEDTEAVDPGMDNSSLRRPFQPGRGVSPVPSLPRLAPRRDSEALSVVHSALFSPKDRSTSPSADTSVSSHTERDAPTPMAKDSADDEIPQDESLKESYSAGMVAAMCASPTLENLQSFKPNFYEYQDDTEDEEQEGTEPLSWSRHSDGYVDVEPSDATRSTSNSGFLSRRPESSTSITSLGSSYRAVESDTDADPAPHERERDGSGDLKASLTLQEALVQNPAVLGGLNIEDIAYMQQELVRSASLRAQANLQRGLANATMSHKRPQAPRPAEDDTAELEYLQTAEMQSPPTTSVESIASTPDLSTEQELLATPPVVSPDVGRPWSPEDGFNMASARCKSKSIFALSCPHRLSSCFCFCLSDISIP